MAFLAEEQGERLGLDGCGFFSFAPAAGAGEDQQRPRRRLPISIEVQRKLGTEDEAIAEKLCPAVR